MDKNHRKSGIAAALVDKIESVAAILKVEKIKAETGNGQVAAMAFYHKNNWTEVSIILNLNEFFKNILKASRVYHPGIIHGIKLVTFFKYVDSTNTN